MYYEFGPFRLRLDRRTLTEHRNEVSVEPQVFDIIAHFVTHPDRVISRDELLETIWDGRIVSDSSISTRINQARKILGDTGRNQTYIKTVHNQGFRFIAKPQVISDELAEPAATAPLAQIPDKAALSLSAQPRSAIRSVIIGSAIFALGGLSVIAAQKLMAVNMSPYIDITQYALGDEIIGVPGRNTLDLSKRTDEGYIIGLPHGVINRRSAEDGRTLYKLTAIENVIGTSADDWLRGSRRSNIFYGGKGNDYLQGYDGIDHLYGGEGDDILNGGYFVDEVFGGPGNDIIRVATDSPGDNMDGGDGVDTLELSLFTYSGYFVDLAAQVSRERLDRDYGDFRLVNVENIIGTPQDDILRGDEGDNMIKGGLGADEIDGAGGTDTAAFEGARADYQIARMSDATLKIAHIDRPQEQDRLINIEHMQFSDSRIATALIE